MAVATGSDKCVVIHCMNIDSSKLGSNSSGCGISFSATITSNCSGTIGGAFAGAIDGKIVPGKPGSFLFTDLLE
jgi:L-fucose isomerase-like protein